MDVTSHLVSAILRSVFTMSFATGVSRITGFLRTAAQTTALGTGAVANAYTLSNTLPNQIYELFMGGLLSSIFIPLLVERLTKHGEEDARRLTNALLTLIVPVLSVVVVLGIVFAGPLVAITTNWDSAGNCAASSAVNTGGDPTGLAVLMFRVFALQILFYGLGAVAMGVLNSHRVFFLPTIAPVLNNFIVIVSFVGYALIVGQNPTLAIYVLAAGTTFGVAVMSLILLPKMLSLGYRPWPTFGHPSLIPAAKLAGPMLVFVAASVGVQVVANFFGSGYCGVEKLWYAFTVFQLPYGVFVVAIATALMPELSERFSSDDPDGYRENLSFGLRVMAFIIVPASVGMVALAVPIVGLLYERGAFEAQDTLEVAALLAAYGVGLFGYATYFVLVRSFYARQNTKIPAMLNVGLLVAYVALSYLFSEALGLVGVALAFSVSYVFLAIGLVVFMRRAIGGIDGRRISGSLVRILLSGTLMYGAIRTVLFFTGTGDDLPERLIVLALAGGVAVGVYLAASYVLRVEELRSAINLVRRRRAS
ncbi:MAG: murein biosynthesis integral membrane protein MurJ [Rubrobacter sp.]